MFIFKLTVFGWALIAILIFTIIVSWKLASLWTKNGRLFFASFIFLVLACINILFVGFAASVAGINYQILKGKRYTGVVISYKPFVYGNSSNRKTYYTPVVRFKNDKGKLVDLETDISASVPPKIGSEIDIVYSPNQKAQNNETKGWLFRLGGTVFVIVCGFISYKATRYAFTAKPNFSISKYVD